MSSPPPPTMIGRCRVCARSPRTLEVDSAICEACIRRGPRWCAMAIRVREDPAFRARVRAELQTESGRRILDLVFGAPAEVSKARKVES